jgi:homocysteine S-methyltransferase
MIILDGAMSEALNPMPKHPFLWTAAVLVDYNRDQALDIMIRAHRLYIQAGAQIITSNSYQANIQALRNAGIQRDPQQAVRDTVIAAKIAAEGVAQVAASIGPYAAFMADGAEYSGIYPEHADEEILEEFHADKIRVVMMEDPDWIAVETIPNLLETRAVCKALKQVPKRRAKTWISACCKDDHSLVS